MKRPSSLKRYAGLPPPRLYILSDGPKDDADQVQVQRTRRVVENIDWPCSVHRAYSKTNIGIWLNTVVGLNSVFGVEEQAIILEDDCVPEPTFFGFCEQMLEKYRDDQKIMHISGVNFITREQDYCLSKIAHVWGWATWRRAWKLHHERIGMWSRLPMNDEGFSKLFPNKVTWDYWQYVYWRRFHNILTDWDITWNLTCLLYGYSITPGVNLVKNIGTRGTHKRNNLCNYPTEPITLPTRLSLKNHDVQTYTKVFGIKNTPFRALKAWVKYLIWTPS